MNSDITFSLLNFSAPTETKPVKAKPSSSKFSKLSSTKKQSSSSKKENIESRENTPPNKNIAKNLLSTYNDKSKNSAPQGILREKNNFFDNDSNRNKNQPNSNSSFSSNVAVKYLENDLEKILTKKVVEPPVGLDLQKYGLYQEVIDRSKNVFVQENHTDICKSNFANDSSKCIREKNLKSIKSQNNDENQAGIKNLEAALKNSDSCICEGSKTAQANSKSSSQNSFDKVKKCDSLSTSFSSLDSSEPKVRRSANKIAPRKRTESIISISSSPEGDKSFYESLSSFYSVKNSKATKKIVSSTPRCSETFFSPVNLSGDFESAVSAISKENAVSKCASNTSLTKGGLTFSCSDKKKDSNFSSGKERNVLTELSNKELDNSIKIPDDKCHSSKFSTNDKVITQKSSANKKFNASCNSSNKSNDRAKSRDDIFDALLLSFKENSNNLTKSGSKKYDSLKNSVSSEKADSAANSFNKLCDSSKESIPLSQTSGEDNLSRRFKKSDESRIIFDTLKFRGVTIRRHRQQKVLGLQKNFMYDETSSDSSEEEANDENHYLNSEPESRKKTLNKNYSADSRKSYLSDDSLQSFVRKPISKHFNENSKSHFNNSSSFSKGLEASKVLQKTSVNKANPCILDGSPSSVRKQTRSKQSQKGSSSSVDIPSLSFSSNSSGGRNQRKLSSGERKSNLPSGKSSQLSDDSLSFASNKPKSNQPLESIKSLSGDSSTSLGKDLNNSITQRRSSRNKLNSSSEVSKTDSLLDAEKLLNELYGTTWHDKKDKILPRSSVKKKPPKEKPKNITRQTLNFSSDENGIEEDVKKRKALRKKKQNSFINDDSSLSESEDLNFYRTLSNKVSLSNRKPKLKIPVLSSSSDDLLKSAKKETPQASSSESSDSLDVSLKNKNGGKMQSGKKGRLKKSPSFVTRKTNVLTSTLSDSKFKKPIIKKPGKTSPSKKLDLYEISSDSESAVDSPAKGGKRPTSKKNVQPIVNTPIRPNLKKFKITPSKTPVKELPRLSFLASLSVTADENRIHPDAVPYKKFYKTKKEELARRLLILYNKEIFDSRLPDDMLIQWNARMRSTSGYCYNKKVRRTGIEMARVSRIVLSTKILDTPERLRDTLLHEICHSAAWIINGAADGHGPLWKSWANKAMRRFPEVPPIKRCHDYSIKTKFTYRCTSCGYSIGRHSKSLDTTRKRCGYCYGAFELLVNHSKSNRKSAENLKAPRAPSKFALFVKENYSEVKKSNPQKTHAEIMKILGQQFTAEKNQAEKK